MGEGTRVSDGGNTISPAIELSVVMPCYNEHDKIEDLLRDWDARLRARVAHYEIIVVNDGSTDGTGRILDRMRKEIKSLRVIHQLNNGHGRAVRRGYDLCRGVYILQVDPNGKYDPSDFDRLWERRESSVLVLATRTQRLDSLLKQLFSRMLRSFLKLFFGTVIADANVPFRLFRRDLARPLLARLPQTCESVNICLALLMKQQWPQNVVEVPVPFRRGMRRVRRPFESVAIIAHAVAIASELLRLRVSLIALRLTSAASPVPLSQGS